MTQIGMLLHSSVFSLTAVLDLLYAEHELKHRDTVSGGRSFRTPCGSITFNLSHLDIGDLLAERGIIEGYETVRLWCIKFGPRFCEATDPVAVLSRRLI